MQNTEGYTSKVVYHFTQNSEKVKQVQLFRSTEDAAHWAHIQETKGFTPVSIEDNADVDAGMRHVGDTCPQVHTGHYSSRL
jgi:hypothetical protein